MNNTDERGSRKRPTKDVDESRRKFLEKAGKLAIYTPPATMVLMRPSMATVVLSNGQPDPCQFPGSDCPP